MLFGGNLVREDRFAFGIHVGIERELQIGSVWMENVASDTRVLPPGSGTAPCTHVIVVLLDGTFAFHPPRPRAFVGPAAFVVPFAAYDGRDDPRTCFRVGGPGVMKNLELRLDAHHLVRAPSALEPLPLDSALLDAVRSTFDALWERRDQTASVHRLLEALITQHVLRRTILDGIVTDESLDALRTWNAIAPFIGVEPPSLTVLAKRAALSQRQLARDLEALGRIFPKRSFRWTRVLQGWRLRYAMLLLSLASLSVAQVARRAGYQSTEALNHAFKRAGMPTPSETRALLLEPLPRADELA